MYRTFSVSVRLRLNRLYMCNLKSQQTFYPFSVHLFFYTNLKFEIILACIWIVLGQNWICIFPARFILTLNNRI